MVSVSSPLETKSFTGGRRRASFLFLPSKREKKSWQEFSKTNISH